MRECGNQRSSGHAAAHTEARVQRGLLWPCGRGLCTPAALDGGLAGSTADNHLTPSTVTQMFVVGADPEHASMHAHAACTLPSAAVQPIVEDRTQWGAECDFQQSAGLRRFCGRVQAACYGQPPRQTLPLRLWPWFWRRGRLAEPAQRARPPGALGFARRRARGFQGHRGRPSDLAPWGQSALAGRRLAAATAGLRKASEFFAHSCAIYSHNVNEPRGRARAPAPAGCGS